ncbi:MAG: hypothetical protein H7Y32_11605 [Chloroflexales bacterium]|nr:hypothetical protein [Chloroflexales bacterium]
MTTLDTSVAGELHLTLRGAAENRILATLRRWPHWRLGNLERDPANVQQYQSITLITDQAHEATVREILKRSFGLTFPPEGGSSELAIEEPTAPGRRRSHWH